MAEHTQAEWEQIACRETATTDQPHGRLPHRFGTESEPGQTKGGKPTRPIGANRCVYCDLTVAMLNAGRR